MEISPNDAPLDKPPVFDVSYTNPLFPQLAKDNAILPADRPKAPEKYTAEKYAEALAINDEIVGQIWIPDTDLNYYVFYSGDDFYLRHDIYRRYDNGGVVYMDKRNSGDIDRNTMLHAHNFGSYGMFYPVTLYKNKEFYDTHRIIHFNTLYADMEWEVFGVYVTPADKHFIRTSFNDNDQFFDFIDKIKNASLFKSDYISDASDKILTLNTCSYEYGNAHTIVHARLIKTTYHYPPA